MGRKACYRQSDLSGVFWFFFFFFKERGKRKEEIKNLLYFFNCYLGTINIFYGAEGIIYHSNHIMQVCFS